MELCGGPKRLPRGLPHEFFSEEEHCENDRDFEEDEEKAQQRRIVTLMIKKRHNKIVI